MSVIVLRERNSHTVEVTAIMKSSVDLPQSPKIMLPCDPDTILLGVYAKERNCVSWRHLPPSCNKVLCTCVSYEMNSDVHGRRMEDSVCYVHSGVLFNHREWCPAALGKMDRITGHDGKLHEPDTGRRAPISSLKCETIFKIESTWM